MITLWRRIAQAGSLLLYNLNLKGLLTGNLFRGATKRFCVPGLNCYSCPAAVGACPLGSLQSALGAKEKKGLLWTLGLLVFFGAVLGRFICGWLCPIGLAQECAYCIPGKKAPNRKTWLRWVKFVLLALLVVAFPLATAAIYGVGIPAFCKWICPAGTIAGIELVALKESFRGIVGANFIWKVTLLVGLLVVSVFVYRPFCKALCPLGAFYGLFNRFALLRLHIDEQRCVHCGKCASVCPMGLDPVRECNGLECIRCGRCVESCPQNAIKSGLRKAQPRH